MTSIRMHGFQEPLPLATVVPRALVPPSDTVTVERAIAVPVRLTESFGFKTPWLMVGTATF